MYSAILHALPIIHFNALHNISRLHCLWSYAILDTSYEAYDYSQVTSFLFIRKKGFAVINCVPYSGTKPPISHE